MDLTCVEIENLSESCLELSLKKFVCKYNYMENVENCITGRVY